MAPPPPGGRSLLLAPCPAGGPEQAALESRVLEAEEENRRIRLQLGRLQAGNYGNQQWGASADTGPDDGDTAEDRNHTDCPRSAPGVKCEVSPDHLLIITLIPSEPPCSHGNVNKSKTDIYIYIYICVYIYIYTYIYIYIYVYILGPSALTC